MLPSETMIWQPEFTDKTLSRKPGAVHLNQWRRQCPKREYPGALWIPVLRSFSSSSTRSWLTVVSDLQNTNGD
ncbi:hypothetical protein GSG56_01710 [Escherichia coli]|nr:hypothetical protein [Escherichia coli]